MNIEKLLVATLGIAEMGALASKELETVTDTFGPVGSEDTVRNILDFESRVFSNPEEYLDNINSLNDSDKVRLMQFAQFAVRQTLAKELVAALSANE